MRGRLIRWGLPLVLVAVVAVSGAMAAGAALTSSGATVKLVSSAKYGKVLVNAAGMTLYRYTPDRKGKSVCTGACLKYWPPLLVKGTAKPTAGAGANASLIGIVMRSNGAHQVSYAGYPLYYFLGDKKAGQITGQGFQKTWYVVNASGAMVKHAVAGGGTPPPTTTGGSAWG